jgi:hypothetical protein
MARENAPEQVERNLRYFTRDAYECIDTDPLNEVAPKLDVNGLVGADGERLEPIDGDYGHDPSRDPGVDWTFDSLAIHEPGIEGERLEGGARRILECLVSRKAPEAAETFQQAVGQMIEPLRTVAVTYFYGDNDAETTARLLHTSEETVDFLVQIALMYLEPLVKFDPPHLRTPTNDFYPVGTFDRTVDLPEGQRHNGF